VSAMQRARHGACANSAVARPAGRASETAMHRSRSLLASRARAMRAAPTTAEALLWEELRSTRLGVVFRRQVVIGPYVVDFCASRARLVVEVDGGYHEGRSGPDTRRDRQLAQRGYRVLRLPAAQVQHQLGDALAAVRAALVA
jgi:very-short-patch-repair endonuclease